MTHDETGRPLRISGAGGSGSVPSPKGCVWEGGGRNDAGGLARSREVRGRSGDAAPGPLSVRVERPSPVAIDADMPVDRGPTNDASSSFVLVVYEPRGSV